MYRFDEAQINGEPDGWASPIALADALECCGSESTAVEVGGITIGGSEEAVNYLDCAEHAHGHWGWNSQSLQCQGARGVCGVVIAVLGVDRHYS